MNEANIFVDFFPSLLLLFSFPHFLVTYFIWFKRVSSWKDEWWVVLFAPLYCLLFYLSFTNHFAFINIELVLKISYAYMLYHFAQQLFGVHCWLNGFLGFSFSGWRKSFSRFYFIFGALYFWIELETRSGVNTLFYYPVASWPVSSAYLMFCFYLFLFMSLVEFGFIIFDFFKYKKLSRFAPLTCLGLVWVWFIPPINSKMLVWLPVLHGVQYFPFILMKLSGYGFIKKIQIGLFSVLLGWVLFRYLPFNLFSESTIVAPFLLSLLNNHHFLIDGRIWKLRDPHNVDLRFAHAGGSGN
jgi:hypothetical protein